MAMEKPHEYMVNYWFSGDDWGTGCMLRTRDKDKFEQCVKETIKKYRVTTDRCRLLVYDDLTVWSFAVPTAAVTMKWIPILTKPITKKWGWMP